MSRVNPNADLLCTIDHLTESMRIRLKANRNYPQKGRYTSQNTATSEISLKCLLRTNIGVATVFPSYESNRPLLSLKTELLQRLGRC